MFIIMITQILRLKFNFIDKRYQKVSYFTLKVNKITNSVEKDVFYRGKSD